MPRVYVPWSPRRRREWSAPERALAAAAAAVYRVGAPVIQRFPGVVFLTVLVLASLAAWLTALACSVAVRVRQVVLGGGDDAGGLLAYDQIAAAAEKIGTIVPVPVLYLLQSLLVRDLLALLGIVTFVSILAMFAIWWERKVAGFIQSRLGPMRVGGWHGWSQSLADGIKLIAKEDLIPTDADRPLFRLAPYLSFVPAVMAFLALPFGAYWVLRNLDVALLFILAMLGLEVLGVLVAGWASNNKWSVYGALREAAQVVSYEIPMGFSLLIPIMVAGSLRLAGPGSLAEHQAGGWFNWLAWHSPWTFVAMFTYFISSLASCKRAPFDLPEAESELVAGFHTEYSGIRWSLFFFAEYAAMFVVSALLVILFLGGWDAPWVALMPAGWNDAGAPLANQLLAGLLFTGPVWFIIKCLFFVYVQMWLRWTLPRLRIDQVLFSCVQVMLPLTLVVLLASTAWELGLRASPAFEQFAGVVRIVLALVGVVMAAAVLVVAAAGFKRQRELVGTMAVDRPLRWG